jgi:KaiC/GvpD/RAD55 family RecA-like ATPase
MAIMIEKDFFPFEFGVKNLDGLIRHRGDPIRLQSEADQIATSTRWSAAIVGPDGCGKSILGLHLCSNYRLNAGGDQEIAVVYVSTDLSFEQANCQWKNFGLNAPKRRMKSLRDAYLGKPWQGEFEREDVINLRPLRIGNFLPTPDDKREPSVGQAIGLSDFFRDIKSKKLKTDEVFFIDLQRDTAGDDWAFVAEFIGQLPNKLSSGRKHLLVIDAVEGLQTFVGETDGFGQRRNRRSRVAQILRCAMRCGVHIVFIVEEPRRNARLPEQFVTDLVLRLHANEKGDYSQRTIEVEKCRAFAHARGKHEFSIRSGVGTFTGTEPHLDDPKVIWHFDREREVGRLSHLHIIPSVHRILKDLREQPLDIVELKNKPSFGRGLEDLNDLFD